MLAYTGGIGHHHQELVEEIEG
jgi:hypothetical protein